MTRIATIALFLLSLALPSFAAAQTIQLEGNIATGLDGLFSGDALAPGVRIGWVATERLVLSTGLSGSYQVHDVEGGGLRGLAGLGGLGAGSQTTTWSVLLPLELLIYTTDPTEGNVVPTVRLGAAYARSEIVDFAKTQRLSTVVLGGASYFFTRAAALTLEVGPEASRYWSDPVGAQSSVGSHIGVEFRTTVLLRL
jgi:hypothetical protein